MEANTTWAGILILIGMAVCSAAGTAQPAVEDDTEKRVNPKQALIDELLREPNYSPRLREAREKGYIAYLRATPGEDVSKYDRGERMTDEEFRSVRRRIAKVHQVEGDALGSLALGEAGRLFLQPYLSAARMYQVLRNSEAQLEVVYIEALAIQPIARIEKGGGISRKESVIKDWMLPQFPAQWPFLDEQKNPIFPAAKLAVEGDMVVAKDSVLAPTMPADAIGWAYPLKCGGMLGADCETLPPAGDLLWIRPWIMGGGLWIEYSGPNKTGTYAWLNGGLRIHWANAPEQENLPAEDATYWSMLNLAAGGIVHSFFSMPPSGVCFIGDKNFKGPVYCSPDGHSTSGAFRVNDIIDITQKNMVQKQEGDGV